MKRKKRKAYEHQREALAWAHGQATPAFFLEMRLGKCLVAIRWACREGEGPYLVVCPLSVCYTWMDELQLEHKHAHLLSGPPDKRIQQIEAVSENCNDRQWSRQWFITNYESLFFPGRKTSQGKPELVATPLAKVPWQCVILDESPAIRNPLALRTRACLSELADAPRRCLLSGLPNPEGLLDFVPQFLFLKRRFLGYTDFWKLRLGLFEQYGFDWEPKPGVKLLFKKHVNKLAFARTRKEVGHGQLVVEEKRIVQLPPEVTSAYERAERDFALGSKLTKWKVVAYNWMRQLVGGRPVEKGAPRHDAKLNELVELLTGELANQRVLVWFEYLPEGRAIELRLREAGLRVRRIVGSVPIRRRHEWKRRFHKGELQVLCLLRKCSKFGLDLSAASAAIDYSQTMSHDDWAQARERMAHPEKKSEPLLFVSLLADQTLDIDMYRAVRRKHSRSREVLEYVATRIGKRVEERNG